MGVACLEFRGENFHGWLKNCKIRESFLPRIFPSIHIVSTHRKFHQQQHIMEILAKIFS